MDRSLTVRAGARGPRRFASTALLVFLAAAAPAFAQEGRAGSVAILPYFAPRDALPAQYSFVLYAVVDVIRLALLDERRFAVVERSELEDAVAASGLPSGWEEDEASCLGLARSLGVDYLIRGYVAWTGDRLKVVHLLLDARSGRTVHVGERKLGTGPDLVADVEESAREFSLSIGRSLPDREPDTVVVETEKVVVRETVVERERARRSFEAGGSMGFYLGGISQYLAPSAGVRLAYRSALAAGSALALGIDAELYLLNQRQSFFEESGQSIDVLFMPVRVAGRWSLFRSRVLGFDLSAAAGPAVVFGLVSPKLISYFRPTVGLGAELSLFPESTFSLVLGGEASWTFYIYDDLQLPALQPRALVRLNF